MKTRFILLCLAASLSLSAQECLQIDYSDERNIEAIENQYAFLKSLLDNPSKLNRNSQSNELNVPLNFHFFYNPGDRIVREELIVATINRTNEVLQMNNIDVNVYMGCVTHEFNEPDLVVWEEVSIGFNTLNGIMNINLGTIEFAVQSISDLFSYGINVFVPNNIVGAAGLGGLAGPARIIALDRDEVINGGRGNYLDNGDGTFTNQFNAESTLAHELGHYCGLFHTDEGGVLANILQGNIPNPIGLLFARCREEAVNRERNYTFLESLLCGHTGRVCASSADGLCDTNADPGIVGTFALTGCQIPVTAGNINIADTWGTPYLTPDEEPMTQNMMSQRLEACRWEFTNLQGRIITNFLNSRFGDNLANPDQYEPNDSNDRLTRTPISLNEEQLHTRHELTCDDQLDPIDNLIFTHDINTNNSSLSQYVVTIADISGENNPIDDVVIFEANTNEDITGFAIATRENIGTETRYTISNACNAHPDNYIIQVRFNNTGDNEIDLGCYNISITEEPAIRMVPFGEEIVCSNQQFEVVGAPSGAIINWTTSSVTLDQTVGSVVNMLSFTPNAAEYWVRAEITDGNCTKTIVNEFFGVSTTSTEYEIRELRESCWDEFDPNAMHTFGTYQIFPRPIGVEIEWSVVGANIEFGNNSRIVRASPDSPGGFSLGVNIVDECGLTSVTWEDFASVECFQYCVGTGTNLNVHHCELNVDLDLKLNAKSSYSYIITSQENKLLMDSAEYMTGKKFAVDVSAYPESDYMLHLYCSEYSYNSFEFSVQNDVCSVCEIEVEILSISNPTCGMDDGFVYLSPSSGTAPYYWDNGNGQALLNPNFDNRISDLSEGDHIVTITDSNGCTTELDFYLKSFELSLDDYIFIDHQCEGDLFDLYLNILANTDPFTYLWNDGNQDPFLNGVPEGNYTVTVTDFNGCTGRKTFSLNGITTTIRRTHPYCGYSNGVLEAKPNGVEPFSYLWSNNESSRIISNLFAGSYSLTVTDGSGCTVMTSALLSNRDRVPINFSVIDEACYGGNGHITAIPSGIPPFSYLWDDGSTIQSLSGLNTGTYSVTVTDANGCSGSDSEVVQRNDYSLQVNPNAGNPICGLNNGIIIAGVDGDFRVPLSYSWNTGSITKKLSDLSAGSYSVTVSDNAGCSGSSSITLVEVDEFMVSATGGDAGLSEGRYLPQGVTIDWFFNPLRVTDRLIIESPSNTILNTGGVTQDKKDDCNASSCCSDYFLGDLSGQIDLLVGSGIAINGNVKGEFITQEAGLYTFEVNGAICASGTGWHLNISCSGNSSNMSTGIEVTEEFNHSTGLMNDSELKSISVFPIPTASELLINKSQSNIPYYDMRLISADGKVVADKSAINSDSYAIDISNFVRGIYFIHLISEQSSDVRKVVVE